MARKSKNRRLRSADPSSADGEATTSVLVAEDIDAESPAQRDHAAEQGDHVAEQGDDPAALCDELAQPHGDRDPQGEQQAATDGSNDAAPRPTAFEALPVGGDVNTDLLRQIQAQLTGLCEGMASHFHLHDMPLAAPGGTTGSEDETESLRDRIADLEATVEDLERQKRELKSQIGRSSITESVLGPEAASETLSWADRKQQILEQLEAEAFEAEDFIASLGDHPNLDPQDDDPIAFVQRLSEELARREQEISELQHLLEQQSETRQADGVSIGAAGIAEMFDADELVRAERERLQQLQSEWEEKFRQGEIEASLERAKLSRERRELAAKQAELEAELEKIHRQTLQETEKNGPRKWLSHLGLAGT